jgi:hypothetical protein
MPKICDMGQTALLHLRRKACCGFFCPKIAGSNPRSWVPEASMLTTRPPKPLRMGSRTSNVLTYVVGQLSRGSITNVPTSSCKLPVILFIFKKKTYFLCIFPKILKYLISRNSIQWELSRIMRTDRCTDRYDEANSRFSKFRERAYEMTVPATTLPLFATIKLHEYSHCLLNFSKWSPSTKPQSKTCSLHSVTMPLLKLLFLFYDIGLSASTSCPSIVKHANITLHARDSAPPPPPPWWISRYWTMASPRSQSVGLLGTSDQLDADNSTCHQDTTFIRERHPRTPAGFEPILPASGRPQSHALDHAATGIGKDGVGLYLCKIIP